ncbi:bifunctional 4-hydroxy-2-oxoglutarate aldolase/2-dehydro-3-deoxy-phosphogluconate aldolase [Brevibacillus sp. SYP-B805]|uniref:bifunctional 4-hydroxy-2-oxoglutarate aldolase/2-dehydro-3-deoxy-phosphogluconate aldolase n=1 Tax=Brevibacillus sp. SYP-B805 TaxID=1578199 RepID=UPI0013ED0E6B|nr:bifunctional 4-hydroxy-2-oxoglutarate aldolase/2-dehydro-3-deoxy-phosphogluconate aldolase [Brevibacillus sp. SYP-B805]NGQ95947.1 bifunctional 4-hydroxy-2-oxoglutarate aldolase/2-dehydro-3-deoxy-phosphogluconate aldolase [Brevibacillus sp. SYP-B805]
MLEKAERLQNMIKGGIIAILRHVPEENAVRVAESLVEGGVTALEVPVQTAGAFRAMEAIASRLQGKAVVGAGTVLDAETARLSINCGAEFLFSPSLHQEVIRTGLRYGKIVVPGVMTPTEMIQAMEWGADLVKIFPAGSLGPSYVKDVRGPFPHIPVIPTGGVNLENAAAFIKAGAVALGVGGSLVDSRLMAAGEYDKLRERAARFVDAVKAARTT